MSPRAVHCGCGGAPVLPHLLQAQAEGSPCGREWDSPEGQHVPATPRPAAPPALLLKRPRAPRRLFMKPGLGNKATRNTVLTEFLLPASPDVLGASGRPSADRARLTPLTRLSDAVASCRRMGPGDSRWTLPRMIFNYQSNGPSSRFSS